MSDVSGFPAHAFSDELKNGRCSGTLSFCPGTLEFVGGERHISIPLQGMQLVLGGAGNRLIFVTHPARPGWQFYTSDHALLNVPQLKAHPAVVALLAQRRRHRQWLWGSMIAALLLLVMLPVVAYFSVDALSAVAAKRIPPEWESSLGENAIKQYQVQKTFMPQKQAEALLAPLVQPLVKEAGGQRKYHFYVVDDPSLNAFALPGGYVVIHSGLILKAQKAEQLQGVLGHELAHVTQQHGVRSVMRSVGIYAVAQMLLGDASGVLAGIAGAAPLLINQKYSRDFEREADREGLLLLEAAKINPHGLVDFFGMIQQEEKKQLKQLGDEQNQKAAKTVMAYLGTHPETDERIANLRREISRMAPLQWRNDQVPFAALQQQVKTFVSEKTESSDESGNSGQ